MAQTVENDNPFQRAISNNFGLNKKTKMLKPADLRIMREWLIKDWFPKWGFDPAEFERNEMDKMAAWIAAYWKGFSDPEYRPKKCLLLCGPTGRGKTMLAKLLSYKFELPFYTADDVDKYFSDLEGYSAYFRNEVEGKKDIILDDIGSEMLRCRYGNLPEFPQVLVKIYESWNYRGKLVIGTTNFAFTQMGYEAFVARYGERIADRLVEMFMTVRLNGSTNHRWKAHE